MTEGLVLPGRRVPAPLPPERIALDMAFGAGNPAVLGDKSRYNSHGAITTATVAAGVHGLCLDFVAANPDYVEIPAAVCPQLNFTSERYSFIFRLRADSLVGGPRIFCRGWWLTDGYIFLLSAIGEATAVTFQLGPSQWTSTAAGSILINNWYTIGFSRNGASIRIYINGVDSTAVAAAHIDPVTCNRNAYIGVNNALASPYDGRMEFLRIFRGVALTASEHLAWHRALA